LKIFDQAKNAWASLSRLTQKYLTNLKKVCVSLTTLVLIRGGSWHYPKIFDHAKEACVSLSSLALYKGRLLAISKNI